MYRCVTFWPVWTAEITLHNQNWLISPTHTAVHVRLMADGGGGGGGKGSTYWQCRLFTLGESSLPYKQKWGV